MPEVNIRTTLGCRKPIFKSGKPTLVLDALTMPVWCHKPKREVIINSGQRSLFGSIDFARWCKELQVISRRDSCYDPAVAESFFGTLKLMMKIIEHEKKVKQSLFNR
jgi:putative transposase